MRLEGESVLECTIYGQKMYIVHLCTQKFKILMITSKGLPELARNFELRNYIGKKWRNIGQFVGRQI